MAYTLDKISDDLFLVAFNAAIPGYEHFLSAWIYVGEVVFVVDPGPSVTVGELMTALTSLGVNRLDYILLTHVHIDHTGSVGALVDLFPEVQVVCHSQGIPSLMDPRKLIPPSKKKRGSPSDNGDLCLVPEERILEAEAFMSNSVMPLTTPGYAMGHVSYYTDRYLFTGEAGGVCFIDSKGRSYMRPSTPVPFYFDIFMQSLENLMELRPQRICYGHFGSFEAEDRVLWQHREQLRLWDTTVRSQLERGLGGEALNRGVLESLLERDPRLLPFLDMRGLLQQREFFFLSKSLQGFLGNALRSRGALF